MTGRAPKRQGTRQDRERKRGRHVLGPDDTLAKPPIIPLRWLEGWNTWAASPQATLFSATDWQSLKMLLPAVERYYKTGEARDHRMIRALETKLGGTIGDRETMALEIVDHPSAGVVPVPSMAATELRDPRKRSA